MRVGILETGHPSRDLGGTVLSFPAMIRTALGPAYIYSEFDVTHNELPDPRLALDAYVITGSPSGVHDGEGWIGLLRDWLTAADPAKPLVGICFGHQIMAEAFGGLVDKSTQGWAIGLTTYSVGCREEWMDDLGSFVLPAFNRDEVIRAPSAARVVATGDFCRYGALSYSDRRAISFQGHPEFTRDFTARGIDMFLRRGTIGAPEAERARGSLQQADDCVRVIGWIRQFLKGDQGQ